MASAAPRTIAVIDGNSLTHRAFHAVPPTMTAPDGTPTNAVFGFMNMFLKMLETLAPDGVVCAFDKGKPRVRMEMLPQYKAQRPPMDPNLRVQFPVIKQLLGAMDVPVVELEGWEGDDILGTLARRGEDAGYDMLLVTGDRDMYQLSTDHVRIVGTRKGLSDVAIMTPESVSDLYHGITPQLVPDFYGLKGDTSDNIPGVPGIGPKKASDLIATYGSLDEVIAHADEVKGKMGENLRAHIDDALLSRKVATIRTDAPIDFDLDSAEFPTFDPQTAREAFSTYGFTGLTGRILALASDGADGPAQAGLSVEPGEVVEGVKALGIIDDAIASGEWMGLSTDDGAEAGTLFGTGTTMWVSVDGKVAHVVGDDVAPALVRCLTEGHVAAADIKAIIHVVCPVDSGVSALVDPAQIDPAHLFDVSLASYLLDSSSGAYGATDIAGRTLDVTLPDPSATLPQAAIDALVSRLLVEPLEEKLEADGSASLLHDMEIPLTLTLVRMERTGLAVDPAELARQSAELGADIAAHVSAIHEQAGGEQFNLDSPMQLSHVLFDVMGLPTAGLKKTTRGYYSTNAKVLERLAVDYPIVGRVLEYREKAKIRSTYLDALPNLIAPGDHRIHTTLNQTVAATGRLSSSNPNLQNIPVRSELGRRVRTAFAVPEGSVFLACDYSQIELRLLAHLSGDEHLIAAFNSGADFHAATAARVFGVGIDEVTPALRSRAKAVNFGIVYGQQAYGLSQSLRIPMGEAQAMIDRYFEAYPGVREYLDRTVAEAKQNVYAITMYGRKRHVPDIVARNVSVRSFGERTAMNHPMQGTAADIIKVAMIRVDEALRREGLSSKLVLQIHDELDLEVPQDEIERVCDLVKSTMEDVVELKVPLLAEVSYGRTWAEAK